MKAAVMVSPGNVQVQDVPEPQPKPNQIKVKIAYCGICGSELHAFQPEFQTGIATFRGPARPSSGPGLWVTKPRVPLLRSAPRRRLDTRWARGWLWTSAATAGPVITAAIR